MVQKLVIAGVVTLGIILLSPKARRNIGGFLDQ